MTVVRTNLPTWFQDNGEPLLNGYIYVGEPNQDPRNFPKTVTFQDSQGNQFPAAQPLRTNGDGRIQWNGKAVIATVSGNYSLRIEDSSQQLIENGYIPFVEDETGSGSGITLTDYREYALTLNDVKALNKTPGETVGNVGGASSTDGDGGNWIVTTATGNPADDKTLIDFTNGTQGIRIESPIQPSNAGFARASTFFVANPIPAFADRIDLVAVLGTTSLFGDIGPTGSGATHIWPALDVIPKSAKILYCRGRVRIISATSTDFTQLCAKPLGDPASLTDSEVLRATGTDAFSTGFFMVALSDDNIFEAAWTRLSLQTHVAELYVHGYGS